MVELWAAKRVREPGRAQTAYEAAVYRVRMTANPMVSAFKSVMSRLASMYRIPSVHPLASLTPISRGRSPSYGIWEES